MSGRCFYTLESSSLASEGKRTRGRLCENSTTRACMCVCKREKRATETRTSFFAKAPDSRKRDSDEKSPRHLLSSSRITYVGGKAVYVTSLTFLRGYVAHLPIQRAPSSRRRFYLVNFETTTRSTLPVKAYLVGFPRRGAGKDRVAGIWENPRGKLSSIR